jgi:uncharacterized membrane protein YesL
MGEDGKIIRDKLRKSIITMAFLGIIVLSTFNIVIRAEKWWEVIRQHRKLFYGSCAIFYIILVCCIIYYTIHFIISIRKLLKGNKS